ILRHRAQAVAQANGVGTASPFQQGQVIGVKDHHVSLSAVCGILGGTTRATHGRAALPPERPVRWQTPPRFPQSRAAACPADRPPFLSAAPPRLPGRRHGSRSVGQPFSVLLLSQGTPERSFYHAIAFPSRQLWSQQLHGSSSPAALPRRKWG